jgi:hypothetical protein
VNTFLVGTVLVAVLQRPILIQHDSSSVAEKHSVLLHDRSLVEDLRFFLGRSLSCQRRVSQSVIAVCLSLV